jgi:hypothetical protein
MDPDLLSPYPINPNIFLNTALCQEYPVLIKEACNRYLKSSTYQTNTAVFLLTNTL